MPRARAASLLVAPWLIRCSTCRSRGDKASSRCRAAIRSRSRDLAPATALPITDASNGFSMKSNAPAFSASTASGISAWPAMTMTGSGRSSGGSARTSARPDDPGMMTSQMMTPIGRESSASRNRSALPNDRAGTPDVASSSDNERHISGSSSMM
ncbi:hypothetical protein WR25_12910 [Diploscapter pachys]|uniref:Secreted protein n=1 Tax=Diploscapter pachys TaxID=2018661 RepID=A0A2A2K4D1_9BILA|nr:hypothetical protein WR25_12910 [Diploscapter pachys]